MKNKTPTMVWVKCGNNFIFLNLLLLLGLIHLGKSYWAGGEGSFLTITMLVIAYIAVGFHVIVGPMDLNGEIPRK